jgi:hypothetical protein
MLFSYGLPYMTIRRGPGMLVGLVIENDDNVVTKG